MGLYLWAWCVPESHSFNFNQGHLSTTKCVAVYQEPEKKRNKHYVDGGPARFEPREHADDFAQALNAEARRLGLGPTTITTPDRVDTFPQYMDWLGEGRHGEMGYLARADRVDMNVVLPGVQSVICTSLVYWPGRGGFPAAHTVPAPGRWGHRRHRHYRRHRQPRSRT
jgi:hypothetical protein